VCWGEPATCWALSSLQQLLGDSLQRHTHELHRQTLTLSVPTCCAVSSSQVQGHLLEVSSFATGATEELPPDAAGLAQSPRANVSDGCCFWWMCQSLVLISRNPDCAKWLQTFHQENQGC
jgi:hypothetical protein